jgi:catechol 2,3-dioxygenase-like lactoylglutathione lyase family enzyme
MFLAFLWCVGGELFGELASRATGFAEARLLVAFLGKDGDNHTVELIQYVTPPGLERHAAKNDLGATHLCFTVDNLDAAHAEFSDRGVRFESPPVQIGSLKACLARDPEGNWPEFIELLS